MCKYNHSETNALMNANYCVIGYLSTTQIASVEDNLEINLEDDAEDEGCKGNMVLVSKDFKF